MAIAQLERPPELDDLAEMIERGSDRLRRELAGIADAAGTITRQADRAATDLGPQAEELGGELEQGMRRVGDTPVGRGGLALVGAIAIAAVLSGLILLARRRAQKVRKRSAKRRQR